jgi:orotidine-5'-phosphate decarboxylase
MPHNMRRQLRPLHRQFTQFDHSRASASAASADFLPVRPDATIRVPGFPANGHPKICHCAREVMTDYAARLHAAVRRCGNAVCVGLDPRWDQLPSVLKDADPSGTADLAGKATVFREFCCRIIDVVAPLVPVVKPQAAFFEELGPVGCAVLRDVIKHARNAGLIVICDAKRGDIGSTAAAYARAYLAGEDPQAAVWAADALTVNPYLGVDTLQPFVDIAIERGAGVYVLVRTSNPGSRSFQDRTTDGQPLYSAVAESVESLSWQHAGSSGFGPVGGVVGATYPQELASLRTLMPHAPLLVPGYGSQGGTSADVAAAFRGDGLGAVVNSSRGIIFAHAREPHRSHFAPAAWEQAVEAATREMIADLQQNVPPISTE